MDGLPWNRIIRLALAGTVLVLLAVLLDLDAKGGNTLGLIQPAAEGPSAAAFERDFPDVELPDGIGHDGQQFYAVARSPLDVDQLEANLDRPRYRLQRPLFPVLAWSLHPTGGGYGLITAMAVVGVGAVLLAGVAAGALSTRLGGGAWPAFLIPILPGTYAALRIGLADTLALGLVLLALFAVEDRRPRLGTASAVLAVLAKESILVVLIGHALVRRTREAVAAAVGATVVVIGWFVALRLLVEADSSQVLEFTWPFGGVVRSMDDWLGGDEWIAGLAVTSGFVLAAIALWRRGPRHRLFGALAATTLFSIFLGPDVVGLDYNGPRTLGPMIALAILTLATPTSPPVAEERGPASSVAAGST